MKFDTSPLKNGIGAEIQTTIDSLLTEEIAAKVRQLLLEYSILIFRGLNLTREQQIALARLIGSARQETDNNIYDTNVRKHTVQHSNHLQASILWHIDGVLDHTLPFASLLTAARPPVAGGQMKFANSYMAYQNLPKDMKDHIAKLKVVHSAEVFMRRAAIEPTKANIAYWRSVPDKIHNLVWTHKDNRKSLAVGGHTSHVEGMDAIASEMLLYELLTWTTQPAFVYQHEWSPGDLLIWDNQGVLHRTEPYAQDCNRVMHHTTLLSETPFT